MRKKEASKKTGKKFKEGAASFYIVAISTLILVIIAASFAAVIVSEVTRTSNDDLSQSAYDAALAGVEDGKLAFYNYQQCKEESDPASKYVYDGGMSCEELIHKIENLDNSLTEEEKCDVVAEALNRNVEMDENGNKLGVLVQEGNTNGNDMKQYYTCTKISSLTDDYLGELTPDDPEHSVRIRFWGETGDGAKTSELAYVRLSWYSISGNAENNGNGKNLEWASPSNGGKSLFGETKVVPPALSLGFVQTAMNFKLSDLDMTEGDATDRGTLYFVPVNGAGAEGEGYYTLGTTNNEPAVPDDKGFAKSNNKEVKNKPFAVSCSADSTEDYACSALVPIPKWVGAGNRNPGTLVFSVALLYGEPKTDYRLEFLDSSFKRMPLDGVQISVDSTGRANDLFRRVDTRLEPADAAYPYPIYGIEALDKDADYGIVKDFYTTCEYNFEPTCPK